MACTGIGEGVLMNEGKRMGMKVRIVDGKMRRGWEIASELERDEVRRYVEYGWQSEGVGRAMRVLERVADGLLRVFWYYDGGCREEDDGDESASVRAEAGSRMADGEDGQSASGHTGIESRTARVRRWLGLSIHTADGSPAYDENDGQRVSILTRFESPAVDGLDGCIVPTRAEASTGTKEIKDPKLPLASGGDTCHWSRDFLTPLNWALRAWLKRGYGDEDHEYVRIVEGRGVRDVLTAEKMKTALLEEFGRSPQKGEFRAGV